jgi:molybdenum cofactor cytidylyltransferase
LDALLPARGSLPAQTVLQTTLDAVLATGLPCHVERQPHAGMGDAIAAAVAKTQDAHCWLILPGDMPLIDPNAIVALAEELQATSNQNRDATILVPMVKGERGHPVGFPKACLADLLSLSGDAGAKALFQRYKTKKIHVDEIPSVAFPEGCLIDMDTANDLGKINKLLSLRPA